MYKAHDRCACPRHPTPAQRTAAQHSAGAGAGRPGGQAPDRTWAAVVPSATARRLGGH